MDMNQTIWPSYYPPQCPPAEARSDQLQAFRLVGNTTPAQADFSPSIIETPHRSFPEKLMCQACGVSIYKKLEDIKMIQAKFPRFKQKLIALVEITQNHGLILETPPTREPNNSHTTWWISDSDPVNSFIKIIPNE